MFKRLSMENFKRFSNETHLDLRKINIFVGPNNSGKSSIVSAFRVILQTLASYDEQVGLLLNGVFGDFGTYKDVVYRNHRGRPMKLCFTIAIPHHIVERETSGASDCDVEFSMTYKFNSVMREIYLDNLQVSLEGANLVHMKYSKETNRYVVEKIGETQIPSPLKATVSREFRVRHFVPEPLSFRLGMSSYGEERGGAYQEFIKALHVSGDDLAVRRLMRISRHVLRLMSRCDYLGPLRTPPQRTYLFSGERTQRIGASGENLTTLLVKGGESKSRSAQSETVLERVNAWLQRTNLANAIVLEPISDRHYELRVQNYFTKEKQNVADVGYGHSQVLPVLVGGYSLPPGATFVMEQPELHLHPKAQAELGDFLLDLYESDVQSIVETHSEHLILRLQQHVAAKNIKPEDIRVFYVHNDTSISDAVESESGSPEVLYIDIDAKGCFSRDWPNGFFPERLNEARKLAQIRAAQQEFKF